MSKMFGITLKNLRIKNDLFQKDLADIFQVDTSTIGYWERGIKEPNYNMLEKIADYFKVSTDYLLGRESEKQNFKIQENQKRKII